MEVNIHYTYDSYGNLSRDSVTAGGPVTPMATASPGLTRAYSSPAHELTFTAFNKIKDMEADNEALGHTYRQAFTYGP